MVDTENYDHPFTDITVDLSIFYGPLLIWCMITTKYLTLSVVLKMKMPVLKAKQDSKLQRGNC